MSTSPKIRSRICFPTIRSDIQLAQILRADRGRWRARAPSRDTRFLAAHSRDSHVPRDRKLGTAPRARDEDVQRWVRSGRAPARRAAHEERELPFVESEVRWHFVLQLGNPDEVILVFVVLPVSQRARSAAVLPGAPAVAGVAAAPVAPAPPPVAAVAATCGVMLLSEGFAPV